MNNVSLDKVLLEKEKRKEKKKINNALIKACQNNDMEAVKSLLTNEDNRADIHYKNYACFTEACKLGNLAIVKYLLLDSELEVHADINANNSLGLLNACVKGHKDIVNYLLLSQELKRHAIPSNKMLIDACLHGQLDIVKILLSYEHIDINDDNDKALINACTYTPDKSENIETINSSIDKRIELVHYLLAGKDLKKHAQIHANGQSALLAACMIEHNNFKLIKYLLTSKDIPENSLMNIEQEDTKSEVNPLIMACCFDNLELVKFLAESKDLTNHADIYYNNCRAFRVSQEETLSYLLEKCDFSNRNISKDVFYHICARINCADLSVDYIDRLIYDYEIEVTKEMIFNLKHYPSLVKMRDIKNMIEKRSLRKELDIALHNKKEIFEEAKIKL